MSYDDDMSSSNYYNIHIIEKQNYNMRLVNHNVLSGLTKMSIQEHVTLGNIRICV